MSERKSLRLLFAVASATALVLLLFVGSAVHSSQHSRPKIRVASKPFTESYILSEMVAQIIDSVGESTGEARAERKFGLGGPTLVFDALKSGDIDVDINYTGALAHLFVKENKNADIGQLRTALAPVGVTLSESLGFNNTYAIAVRTESARALSLATISDLRGHPELRGAFTPDFLNPDDGFYKLAEVYGLKFASLKPMQHSLAYPALKSREIDMTDAYTTDGTLAMFDLVLLKDDQDFFPKYYGVITIRTELVTRFPRTWAALRRLEGRLSDESMVRLNAKVDNKQSSIEETARSFLIESGLLPKSAASSKGAPEQSPAPGRAKSPPTGSGESLWDGLLVSTYEHLSLVLISLLLSCLVGIPLGVTAFHYRRVGHVLIAATGLLQTIPSLALLCFLIPVLGIGTLPTIFTLFIYGLLPVVQSTTAGLMSLDPKLIEIGKILGLNRWQRLRLIELPLASISIMSGIKTTAVINVATATIAALIGAGGYGRYITSGLALNDVGLILKGAIPTALMAVGFHGLFELLSRIIVPRGLQRLT